MKRIKNAVGENNVGGIKEITERSMKKMDKKTKNIIKAGTAAAAVITSGLIMGAVPAYADENCACTSEAHLNDCNCGCNDMKDEVHKAQTDYEAAVEVAAKAENENETAKTELNNAEADYTAAQEHLKNEIDDSKAAAKAGEEEALKKLNEAAATYEKLKSEEYEASSLADKSKEIADTARKVESGELALEETSEYNVVINDENKVKELSTQKDALGKKISESEEKVVSYKEKADSLEKSVSGKEEEASRKQEIIDKSTEDREIVLKEYTELKKEVDLLKKEEEKLENSVADKRQLIESTKEAYDTAVQTHDAAAVESQVKKEEMDRAKKSLDEYNENAEKKRNSADLFRWLLTRDDLSPSLRKSAEVAVRALTNTPNEDEKYGGEVSYGDIMKSTSLGEKDDATHLENVKRAVDYIEEGNGRRDMENTGLEHLLITPRLMAFAELNANYMSKNRVLIHTYAFPASENAASGFNFFYMWYDAEKAIYEEQGDKADWNDVGHYRTLVTPYINLTGFGYTGYYASHTFYVGAEEDGYTVEEFRALIKDYEGFLDSEKQRLANVFSAAQSDYNRAKERLDAALSEKQKAEDLLSDAKLALSEFLEKQRVNAVELSKGEQSLEKYVIAMDETGGKLQKVIAEKEALEKEIDSVKAELKEAVDSYEAEMKVLTVDKEKYEKLSSEHELAQSKLQKDRDILSMIQDVNMAAKDYELKKENHRLAAERLKISVGELNTAQKVYDDKKEASETANKLTYEEALTSDEGAYAQFSEAIEEVKSREGKYIEAKQKYEKSAEALKKAQKKLSAQKEALDKVLSVEKSLKNLCENHINCYVDNHIATGTSGGEQGLRYTDHGVIVTSAKSPMTYKTKAAGTGEGVSVQIWAVLATLSLAAIGGTVIYKRRR